MLTIGIPSKGINASLIRVSQLALSFAAVERVLIGINPGQDNQTIPDSIISDPRVLIVSHSTDLGLYGNFRFLVENATSKYFMWLCTDDSPTSELSKLLQVAQSERALLVIPTWDWSEYFPQDLTHSSERTLGPLPVLKPNKSLIHSAIYAEPGWIFGMWERKYLLSIFPKRSFDWLDSHILQRVLISKGVRVVEVSQHATIGTWVWANRSPHSVKPSGHSPLSAYLYQISTAGRMLMLWPPSFRIILSRFKNLHRQTKALNSNLEKKKR